MRLLHTATKTRAKFDDPNLVSHVGLVPAVRLTENVGLEELVAEHVQGAAEVGANPGVKVGSLVAGMIAGADGIDGMDLLRHGAIPATLVGIRAPSTLGSFLRALTHGNVRQLAAVHRRVLARLATAAPLLPGADTLAFVDVDSVQRRVYGASKQGAAFAPRHGRLQVAAGARPQRAHRHRVHAAGGAGGHHGAVAGRQRRLAPGVRPAWWGEAIATARTAGARGMIVVRADSAPSTAFAANPAHRTQGRLIVRRVKRLNPKAVAQGQGELFATYRYHALFTDSPFALSQAESHHRGHAIIEQLFADLIDGPLAHLPSGSSNANAAWLQLAATAHALTRALGTLASTRHAHARGATIRTGLTPPRRPARPHRRRPDHLAPPCRMALARCLARRLRSHPPRTPDAGRLTLTTRPHGPNRKHQTWISRIRGRQLPHAHDRAFANKDQLDDPE